MGDFTSSFPFSSLELINIAMTLQRYEGELRVKGLELFERILNLNLYGAKEALNEIDGRPINLPSIAPRRRRRRQRTR